MDPYSTRLCNIGAQTNNLVILYSLTYPNYWCWPFGTIEVPWSSVDPIGTVGTKGAQGAYRSRLYIEFTTTKRQTQKDKRKYQLPPYGHHTPYLTDTPYGPNNTPGDNPRYPGPHSLSTSANSPLSTLWTPIVLCRHSERQ
jgi:hypothetical protein